MDASISSAGTLSIWKVNGRNTVIAKLPFIPGTAPKMMPMNIPILMKMRFWRENTLLRTSPII